MRVLEARFVKSATDFGECPRGYKPEVAFAGRSNVGKSSMINALVKRKSLVRVSNTPGRTRTLNFFEVDVFTERKETLRFCDLPGYGYAKVSKSERAGWGPLIEGYLTQRHDLALLVTIVDAEVGPSAADIEMLQFAVKRVKRNLVVATKLDRLSKAARIPALIGIAKTLGLPSDAVCGFSATDGLGWDQVWQAILAATRDAKGAHVAEENAE